MGGRKTVSCPVCNRELWQPFQDINKRGCPCGATYFIASSEELQEAVKQALVGGEEVYVIEEGSISIVFTNKQPSAIPSW